MQLDRALYDTWFRAASLMGVEPTPADMPVPAGLPGHTVLGRETFIIAVPNTITRDMLLHRYYRTLRRVLGDAYGQTVEMRFEVHKPAAEPAREADEMPLFQALAREQHNARQAAEHAAQLPEPLHRRVARPQAPALPDSDLNPRYTLERFLPGTENAMVYAAACSVAEHPGATYNPFYIYGGIGTGKTHLLHAIGHACRERGGNVIYISSEAFTNDLIEAIRSKTTAMFREKYRRADVLLVDDVQFMGGKESTQEEFFHTFNTLYTFGKQIVLAGDRHPRELETLVDRLRSRFEGGLVIDVNMPEYETRVAIVEGWAADEQIRLDRAIIEQIAARGTTNTRELSGLFKQVLASTRFNVRQGLSEKQRTVTLEPALVQDAMDNFARPRYSVTVADVIAETALFHGIPAHDLIGVRRTTRINEARQIAMYLARELTTVSLPQIGEAFGGRKHSTVLHACTSIAEMLPHDERLTSILNTLRERLTKARG